MPKKYIIRYDREGCIGASSCVATQPENWNMADDGKATLNKSKENKKTGYWEREIDEKELEKTKEAAKSCPVNVIFIYDKETGEKII